MALWMTLPFDTNRIYCAGRLELKVNSTRLRSDGDFLGGHSQAGFIIGEVAHRRRST
jgi:hypothetical protein